MNTAVLKLATLNYYVMHSMLNGLHEENKKNMCNNFRPLFAKALKTNVTRLGCDEKYS